MPRVTDIGPHNESSMKDNSTVGARMTQVVQRRT